MEVSAKLRSYRVSPRKCRLVVDHIRGLPVGDAIEFLRFSNSGPSEVVLQVLNSAIANAENNEGADIDELKVTRACVDQGPTQRRFRPRARGRAAGITKRTSHIVLTLSDGEEEEEE